MAEPSERDKQQAQELADGAHEAGLACGDCQDGANGYYICTDHLEPIARAIASAREEGDAAGFERGRRAGLEESCRAACVHCRSGAPIAGVTPMTGTFYHPPKDGERGDFVGGESVCDAGAIRALIGGNE